LCPQRFSMHKILVVDDETGIRESLEGVLADEGYEAASAQSGEECLKLLRKEHTFEVVLLDIWLPGMDGLETLERIRELDNPPEVIMISGHGTIETAVRATKLGAYDFLEKPLSIDKTLIALKNAIESKKLRYENVDLKKQLHAKSVIVGNSIPMKALRQQIGLMAPTNGRVLIYGESGTGKELVARAIHAQSLRKDETFVEVNCAAIPEDLIESELFGHYKGSFPGAATDKEGKFQKASGGTLFLDEVGDMSLKTQSKVLRTLEEQRVAPLGSDETIMVDARIIASTNKDIEEEISIGNFREDLF
jgi:two-component system nitrogen regulation response regulator NtrX